MVPRQQVVDYISSNIRSGYDLPSIRSRLLASGYDPNEVNSAIDMIRSGKTISAPRTNMSMFVLIAIAMVGFLLIAGTALVFFKQSSGSPITSIGGSNSFDQPTSTTKTPTTPSSTTKPTSTTSTTPKGSTSGSGSSNANSGTSNFQGSTTVRDTIPSVDYGTSSSQTTLTTRLAIESKVNQLAVSKPDEAAALCSQINTVAGQQSCLNTVAQASEQSKYCTQISDTDSADTCLTSLALKQAEDVNMCKLMASEIRFRQCVLLYDSQSQLDTIQKAATQVQTPALSDASAGASDQQLTDAYSVDFDTSVSQTSATDDSSANDDSTGTDAQTDATDQDTTTEETS